MVLWYYGSFVNYFLQNLCEICTQHNHSDKVLIMKNKKNKPNEKQKTLFIIIGALVGVFLIYTLFLSPYAQCVSGYIKTHDWNSDKSEVRAEAKITCKALGR